MFVLVNKGNSFFMNLWYWRGRRCLPLVIVLLLYGIYWSTSASEFVISSIWQVNQLKWRQRRRSPIRQFLCSTIWFECFSFFKSILLVMMDDFTIDFFPFEMFLSFGFQVLGMWCVVTNKGRLLVVISVRILCKFDE